jgi:glutathione peroxidase
MSMDAKNTGSSVLADASRELAPVWEAGLSRLDGQPLRLADLRGKALLLVNVASQCGLTPQYDGLEKLQQTYGTRGFTVLGFPCNQFGGQEPGSPEEIATFCSTRYGVSFPLTQKVEVNGPGAHPVYQALTRLTGTDGHAGKIRWNFEKFLLAADGKRAVRFAPTVTPEDSTLVQALEAALP